MARLNLRPGDSATGLPVPFEGDVFQEGFTFQRNCTLTITAHLCSIYIQGPGVAVKIHAESTVTFDVVAGGQIYDVEATSGEGTGGDGTGGNIDYSVT
jgi:hypothetical protein